MSEEVIEEETPEVTEAPVVKDDDTELAKLKADIAKLKNELKQSRDAEKAVRGNSDKLLAEKKQAERQIKDLGLPLDKVKKILSAIDDVDEAEKIAEGRHDEVFEQRLAKFRTDIHDPIVEQNELLKSQVADLTAKISDHNKRPLIEAGWKAAKGKSDKLKYHYAEAARVFNLEDGQFIPRDEKGDIIYGSGGTDPISVEHFFNGLLMDEPDHKIPSIGTDAKGGGDGKTTVTVNPWSKSYEGGDKYTLRAQIKREAPAKAKQLQREAGYTSHR